MRNKLTEVQKLINKFNRGNFLSCSWNIIKGEDLKVKLSDISLEELPVAESEAMKEKDSKDWGAVPSDKLAIISGVLTNFDEQNTYSTSVLTFISEMNNLQDLGLATYQKVDKQLTVDSEDSPAVHADAWEFALIVKADSVSVTDKVIAGKHITLWQFKPIDTEYGMISILFSSDSNNLLLDLASQPKITKASLTTLVELIDLNLLGTPIGYSSKDKQVSATATDDFVSAEIKDEQIIVYFQTARLQLSIKAIKSIYFALDDNNATYTNMVLDLGVHGTVSLWL